MNQSEAAKVTMNESEAARVAVNESEAARVTMNESEAARAVVGRGLSVRQTETYVRSIIDSRGKEKSEKKIDPDIRALQDELSQKVGARVTIQHSAKGKGKLVLNYNSLDELDGILSHIK